MVPAHSELNMATLIQIDNFFHFVPTIIRFIILYFTLDLDILALVTDIQCGVQILNFFKEMRKEVLLIDKIYFCK